MDEKKEQGNDGKRMTEREREREDKEREKEKTRRE